jgi:hypothetical protein
MASSMLHAMPRSALVSRAGNGEDVVLLRAFGHLAKVRFAVFSADGDGAAPDTETLESSGWEGLRLAIPGEPGGLERAISAIDVESRGSLHLLWIAVPREAAEVFPALALADVRPWVLVLECSGAARDALDADAAAAGYTTLLFDGVSQFFLANEHSELAGPLSYPRCSRDEYVTFPEATCRDRNETLLAEVVYWRRLAVTAWADAVADARATETDASVGGDAMLLRDELTAMRTTLSWRVTRPLRALRQLVDRLRVRA